jgi:surface polysaccharide O-acyltransferase-like enzyme
LEPKRKGFNFNVDLIRATAIILVILYHTSDFPYAFNNSQPLTLNILNWFTTDISGAIANISVPLFVMISGAMLLSPEKVDEPARVFAKKRFNRIAVPFIFWTIAYFVWDFLVEHQTFNSFNVAQGLLTGSYGLLWFFYLLLGLYAVTPIFRVLIKHIPRRLFSWLIILWFVGTVITPLIHEFTKFSFNPQMFFFVDWIGYFLLGVYLLNTKIRPSRAYIILILGLLIPVLGAWWITLAKGQTAIGFFHTFFSFGVIIASIGMFLVLLRFPVNRFATHQKISSVIHWISQNTLPIYLLHMMVLISLKLGYFRFFLPRTGIEILDIAIWASATLTITALIVYALKKIPGITRLIG